MKQLRPNKDVIAKASGLKVWLIQQSEPLKSAKVIDEDEGNRECIMADAEEEYQLQQWDLSSYH